MADQSKAEKSAGTKLKEQLFMKQENLGKKLSEEEIGKAYDFAEGYKIFLDSGKTEREVVDYTIPLLEGKGFQKFEPDTEYHAGDKIYLNNRDKALIIAVVGKNTLDRGVQIIASHIDSPRLDVKQSPLYEDTELALFKTHYYGGIKKYQWTTIPLSLHGVIMRADGTKVQVLIGDDKNDPVFCVTDLLPHLAADQMKRTLNEAIKGEELNILVGAMPFKEDKLSESVKLNILNILFEKYGITERDFLCAELEMVPAYDARDVGLDRSMLGAYGQDDRVCAYASLAAILECENPETTVVAVLADKEEVGSDGNTGLSASYLRYFIADLAKPHGIEGRTVLSNSRCLSADVNAAVDPTFPEVNEKKNAVYLNRGVALMKYSGARGKGGTSDASAEFVAEICHMLDDSDVVWQMGELGKVDQGGGGTVAMYVANLGVDVLDIGVPVLSMHAPFEITAKLDIYMLYRACKAFLK